MENQQTQTSTPTSKKLFSITKAIIVFFAKVIGWVVLILVKALNGLIKLCWFFAKVAIITLIFLQDKRAALRTWEAWNLNKLARAQEAKNKAAAKKAKKRA